MKQVNVMRYKNMLIVGLLVIGFGLFAVVQGVIIPQNEQRHQQYLAAQQNPVTHDLSRILPFKNRYMGDASNVANLFQHLPLDVERTYRLHPETWSVEVNYKEGVSRIGEERVHKILIYNAVAAFSLIENLQELHFNFADPSGDLIRYQVTRSAIESIFGQDLSELLTKEKWQKEVQDKLKSKAFVDRCMQSAFVTQQTKKKA